jgi:hypothetical protein
MTTQITLSSKMLQDACHGICVGWSIACAQAVPLAPLNRISVVASRYDLSSIEATKRIFHGTVDQQTASWQLFYKGGSWHLGKELARVVFKGTALVLKPQLDTHFKDAPFGKLKADFIFAGGQALGEMLLQPIDTVRVMRQAGEKLGKSNRLALFTHLYKGASANGFRLFGVWMVYPHSERYWSDVLEKRTSIDPHAGIGLAIKAAPQALEFTAPVWLLERLARELQYRPNLATVGRARYLVAFQQIVNTQGWAGLLRGFLPKVCSNTILATGSNWLLEKGRAKQARG